ncbi:MAG TPA: DNA-binding protein [Desulfobacteraceae bacterium]|nr:DNA-binding protein [Desulfobacteraceae bacterium]
MDLIEKEGKVDRKVQGKRLLSVEEAAEYLGLSPRTIYNAVAPKSKRPFPVKPKRVGKLVKFDIRDLERYVESL